jgi:hypothetical protein
MDQDFIQVTKKGKKGKKVVKKVRMHPTCADVEKGDIDYESVEYIFKASSGASPVTGQDFHPNRHILDGPNFYDILEGADRYKHGGSTLNESHALVLSVLQSNLAQYAFKLANTKVMRGEAPCRIVFCVPQLVPDDSKVVKISFNKVKGSGKAKGAILVFDVDKNGFVYLVTNYMTLDVPKDTFDTAGESNCFCFAKGDVLYVEENGKIIPQLLGGTTYKKDEMEVTREKKKDTVYKDPNNNA